MGGRLKTFSKHTIRWIAAVALCIPVALFYQSTTVQAGDGEDLSSSKNSASLYDELKTFADVLAIVQEDYVKPVDNKKVVEGAIKGMLTTLDPHSGYLDPDFYRDLQIQTKGEFGGLGIEINVKDGLLVVVTPMEGSPAARAGIKPGDAIVKIDGKFTKDVSLVEAVKRMRGPKGSAIKISVARAGSTELLDFSVVRDTIQVKSVKYRLLDDGIGYIRLSQFMEHTSDDMKIALEHMTKQNGAELRGLVLDVRNNPGGLLNQAVAVSDLFLRDGVIVYTDGRSESQRHKYFAHDKGTEPDYPMAVLVNGGSASASEIVSGALQDAARAVIVGTQTFGKGSVQTVTALPNGGAVTLTTALYYTKSGRTLQLTGVKPDIEVAALIKPTAPTANENQAHSPGTIREGDLPGAIANPRLDETIKTPEQARSPLEKINHTPPPADEDSPIDPEKIAISDWLKRDVQLVKALEVVKSKPLLAKAASPTAG